MSDPATTDPSSWQNPALRRLWEVLAARLESRGLEVVGRVRVDTVDDLERRALADLLGRPVSRDRVMVDLAVLDERLRRSAGLGVVEAAERVLGRALVACVDGSALQTESRESPYGAAQRWLEIHPALQTDWVGDWLGGLRRDDVLEGDDGDALVVRALELLWDRRARLLGDRQPGEPVTRPVLAARLVGDAHAFDPDRRLTAVVLRALAARMGIGVPADERGRRDLWESAGVVVDGVSATCLTWGVRWREAGSGAAGTAEAERADGAPRHVTWWDVDAGLAPVGAQMVLVVESPAVLEAVARLRPPRLAVVCTSGRPDLVTSEVLSRLVAAGSRLRYHGSFDWAGVARANAAVATWGATPWLMGADDYLSAPATLPLDGPAVEPVWSAELGEAMRQRGLAVHEEAVLDAVLAELWA